MDGRRTACPASDDILAVGLLSLAAFVANSIFEARAVILPFFRDEYRAYMSRVTARYFTPARQSSWL